MTVQNSISRWWTQCRLRHNDHNNNNHVSENFQMFFWLAAILDACNASACKWHSIRVLLNNCRDINFHSECNDGVDTLRFTEQFILRIPEALARFWTQLELQRQIISCFTAQSNFSSTETLFLGSIFRSTSRKFTFRNHKKFIKIYVSIFFFLVFSVNFFLHTQSWENLIYAND